MILKPVQLVLVWAAIAENHRLAAYKQQTFITHSSGGWKVQGQGA